jgi:hypothetical protein
MNLMVKIEQFYKSKIETIISIIEEDFENKSKVDFENMRSFLENEMAHKLDNYYESIKSSYEQEQNNNINLNVNKQNNSHYCDE